MNTTGSTLMVPDRDREYQDYQASLDEGDDRDEELDRLWTDIQKRALQKYKAERSKTK